MSLRWFPIAYIFTAFFLIPLILLGITTMIDVGGGLAAVGWLLLVAILFGAGFGTYWYKKMGGKQRVAVFLASKKEANMKKHFSGMSKDSNPEGEDLDQVAAV